MRHGLHPSRRARRAAISTAVVLGTLLVGAGLVLGRGGRTLADWQRDLRDPAVDVRVRREARGLTSRIAVAVRDEGPGIAPEHLPRLTERFYRVNAKSSREKGGTGLGLAIVKHIINRHRGELDITSTVGKGSTFSVILPALD